MTATLSDPFLAMLDKPSKQRPKAPPSSFQELVERQRIQGKTIEPKSTPKPVDVARIVKEIIERRIAENVNAPRPDFADDIDRLVRELVAQGDVVYDASTDQYRRPHCRRWRFE